MAEPLRLMCILAHPDDESMGTGGILARYGAEGVETYLVTATRGEYGWQGDSAENPGPAAVGKLREQELMEAAKVLGLREVCLLDYVDGHLDDANPVEVIAQLVEHIRRVRPHVVVTFGGDGAYGHTDHIAISQLTTAAIVRAAEPSGTGKPHSVSKLYHMLVTQERADLFLQAFNDITMVFDGVPRTVVISPDWQVSAVIRTGDYWRTVLDAVLCHQTQAPTYSKLAAMPEAYHRQLCDSEVYYRVFSLVNGGRKVEHDLFEGLR
jgi:LmbE family N-acetylglucosaminyl deacetylase